MFGCAVDIVVDHRSCGVQHGLGGAVILLQQDLLTIGVVAFKGLDVAVIRAAPPVDGLVFVTHHEHTVAADSQVTQDLVLGGVGILKFVHQHFAKPTAVPLTDFGFGFEQVDHLVQ